ncbi:protein-export chaperone SecB [Leuconostoc mesenteroides]|uniref:protein-export chaperone SecB n=1 Tax=Leuconostoc mesenteroides TaxID=1245 RepID=UPI002115971F|nr:protein-export chaperone SecB [Leuconostoc mesenteroides]UUE18602.1 protein-export chaperone SecB [Leuconostoc mesenteroides]
MAKPSAFQFSNPILEKISFNLNDNPELETGKLSLKFGTTDFEDDGSGGKSAKARLIISNEDTELTNPKEQLPYEFSVTYTAVFHWSSSDISDDQASKLLYVNGQALLLSYFRPIINTVVRASGAPNFNLPFIDFRDDGPIEKLKNKNNQ